MSSATHPETIAREVKRYWKVFAALLLGTVITVAVANLRLGILLGIVIAVLVAVVKGSLVAGYFMHLLHERKLIYSVLALTAGLVLALLGLILWAYGDQQGASHGPFVPSPSQTVPAAHHEP